MASYPACLLREGYIYAHEQEDTPFVMGIEKAQVHENRGFVFYSKFYFSFYSISFLAFLFFFTTNLKDANTTDMSRQQRIKGVAHFCFPLAFERTLARQDRRGRTKYIHIL